jgi:hypothetical protein
LCILVAYEDETSRRKVKAAALCFFLAVPAIPPLKAACQGFSDSRAEMAFREVEDRLLGEKSLQFKFRVTSTGTVNSSLQGQLRLKSGNRIEIEISGTFQSNPVKTRFESDGRRMHWNAGEQKLELDAPRDLREAIIIGFTRMGLFHNLALLLGGQPPDHAGGGVNVWVQASDFMFAAPDPASKVRGRSIRFQIDADGETIGEASYWISPLTRVPVERRETLKTPSGRSEIVESYEFPD